MYCQQRQKRRRSSSSSSRGGRAQQHSLQGPKVVFGAVCVVPGLGHAIELVLREGRLINFIFQ
jgi:hypothetical protein